MKNNTFNINLKNGFEGNHSITNRSRLLDT